jgi:hypothetical protein
LRSRVCLAAAGRCAFSAGFLAIGCATRFFAWRGLARIFVGAPVAFTAATAATAAAAWRAICCAIRFCCFWRARIHVLLRAVGAGVGCDRFAFRLKTLA